MNSVFFINMKYTLNKLVNPSDYWNGTKPLPDEINVMSYHSQMAEFELLSILCTLHGYPTAYDLLTGSVPDTEKDSDISSIMTAFQSYLHPKMPPSNYTESDKRLKSTVSKKGAME
jgi:hypothetical protein